MWDIRRSLHRERGLKLKTYDNMLGAAPSLPSQGAWNEIPYLINLIKVVLSLPSQGAWIEIVIWERTVLP